MPGTANSSGNNTALAAEAVVLGVVAVELQLTVAIRSGVAMAVVDIIKKRCTFRSGERFAHSKSYIKYYIQ